MVCGTATELAQRGKKYWLWTPPSPPPSLDTPHHKGVLSRGLGQANAIDDGLRLGKALEGLREGGREGGREGKCTKIRLGVAWNKWVREGGREGGREEGERGGGREGGRAYVP